LEAFKSLGIDRFQTFPAVIKHSETGYEWKDYVLVNTLGRDNVMDTSETNHDEFEFEFEKKLVLDDRKLTNDDKFLVVKNTGIGSDIMIISEDILNKLRELAPLPKKKWGFKSNETLVSDHAPRPELNDLTPKQWRDKAIAAFNKKDYLRAEEYIQNALQLDDADYYTWYIKARIHTHDLYEHRYDKEKQMAVLNKGIELFEKVLSLNSTYAPAWKGLGDVYDGPIGDEPRLDREKVKVKEYYLKAIECDRKYEEVYAEFKYWLSHKELQKIYGEWTQHDPENARAWFEYADAGMFDEDDNVKKERVAAYEKALSIKYIPSAAMRLALHYDDLGETEKALEYISRISKDDVTNFQYGWSRFSSDDFARCKTYLKHIKQKIAKVEKVELVHISSEAIAFWTIETKGTSFTVISGNFGESGETQTQKFATKDDCQKEARKIVEEKRKEGYLNRSKVKLREQAPVSAQPSKQVQELEAVAAEAWKKLEALPEDKLKKLPLTLDELKDKLNAYDQPETIKTFKNDLLYSILGALGEREESYNALVYEWYYAGADSYDTDYGYLYERCYFKDEEPVFKGNSLDEYGDISIDLVLGEWYTEIEPKCEEADFTDTGLLHTLFETKLFLLVEKAYRELEQVMEMPYLFMNMHDNDPTYIAGPAEAITKQRSALAN
jgi:predicted DNA-binding WGR domain protein/tetratricopeptide (TPR) repeat protein